MVIIMIVNSIAEFVVGMYTAVDQMSVLIYSSVPAIIQYWWDNQQSYFLSVIGI